MLAYKCVLQAVTCGAVSSVEDIQRFIMSTLLYTTDGYEVAASATMTALRLLFQGSDGFIQ